MLRLSVILVLTLAPMASASAQTGNAVADAFLRAADAAGYPDVGASEVAVEDGTVVLTGVASGEGAAAQELGAQTVRIVGGRVDAQNTLSAEEVRYENLTLGSPGGGSASQIESVVLTDVTFPPAGDDGTLPSLVGEFTSARAEAIRSVSAQGEVATIAYLSAASEGRLDEGAASGELNVRELSFDISAWDEPAAQQMRALGYETVTIDFTAAGRLEAEGGAAVLENATLEVDGMGTLDLEGSADGLDADTFARVTANLADVQQLLPALQQVSLSGLTLRYADAGLAERILADVAARSNLDRAALVETLVQTIPGALAPLNNREFVREVTEAARTFLSDPGTLTLSAEPVQPVPMAQVFGAVVLSPQTLPDLLSVTLSASP